MKEFWNMVQMVFAAVGGWLGYDLLDEVNCADSCEAVTALCELINELLKDIQHLELECISTRYLLSQYMDEDHGELLRSDILENLGRRHYDSPAYQLFTELQYLSCQGTKGLQRRMAMLALIYH